MVNLSLGTLKQWDRQSSCWGHRVLACHAGMHLSPLEPPLQTSRSFSPHCLQVLGGNFAMRNILKAKRFLLWDDCRPVHYAQQTVEVPTILSLFNGLPFEVQVAQNHQDGTARGLNQTSPTNPLWAMPACLTKSD